MPADRLVEIPEFDLTISPRGELDFNFGADICKAFNHRLAEVVYLTFFANDAPFKIDPRETRADVITSITNVIMCELNIMISKGRLWKDRDAWVYDAKGKG